MTMHFLGKTLLVFALLHSIFQGQIYLLLQVFRLPTLGLWTLTPWTTMGSPYHLILVFDSF